MEVVSFFYIFGAKSSVVDRVMTQKKFWAMTRKLSDRVTKVLGHDPKPESFRINIENFANRSATILNFRKMYNLVL